MPKELAKEPDAPAAKLSPADCHGPLTTDTPTGIAHPTVPYGLSSLFKNSLLLMEQMCMLCIHLFYSPRELVFFFFLVRHETAKNMDEIDLLNLTM